MKTMYNAKLLSNFAAIFLLTVIFSSCSSSKKMEKLHPVDISTMINARAFTFVADQVNPMRGSSRTLTSLYDVKINKDTMNAYLPYFGRAFQAPIDPSKGGIMFQSLNFSYNVTVKNKDEWEIYIEPKDNSEVQQLIFNLFGNGNATLNVQSTHRDPISFYGHIKKIKE